MVHETQKRDQKQLREMILNDDLWKYINFYIQRRHTFRWNIKKQVWQTAIVFDN